MQDFMPCQASPPEIATTRSGTTISYRLLKGAGKGRCVLIHSLAMDASFWNRVAAHLIDAGDVLVYECRGHGRSGGQNGPYTVALHAHGLADLLSAVGWSGVVVAGSSMGGCIALAFAAACPERVTDLGLTDTTAWYGPNAAQQWEERGQESLQEGMLSLVDFQKSPWVSDAFGAQHPELADQAVSVFLDNDTTAYLEACRMLGAVDQRAALQGFHFPTRIMVGAEDYATPIAMAEAMRDAIPGARLRIINGVRRFTALECPDTIAEELKGLPNALA
ncbi:MAG: alpha/beta fold hydrolase [Burkholderiaceae bacterium]